VALTSRTSESRTKFRIAGTRKAPAPSLELALVLSWPGLGTHLDQPPYREPPTFTRSPNRKLNGKLG